MGQKIKITEEQLKRLVESELSEQPSRLASIGNSALSQMNVTATNTSGNKPTQTSLKLNKGVYKNTTVEVLSDGSLTLDIPGKGLYKYQCSKYSPTIKKLR